MWRARSARCRRNQFIRFRKAGELVDDRALEHLDREQRNDSNDRSHGQRHLLPVEQELVVVEPVLLVPEPEPPSEFMASVMATKCSKNLDAMSS